LGDEKSIHFLLVEYVKQHKKQTNINENQTNIKISVDILTIILGVIFTVLPELEIVSQPRIWIISIRGIKLFT